MPATTVHFNGSVNLPNGETVMREISTRIPVGVRRMTDGETGDRIGWVYFQRLRLLESPQFEPVPVPENEPPDYVNLPRLRLVDGVSPDDVQWPDLGYAAAYTESFRTFRALQQEGVVGADVRMQVQYPTPIAGLSFVDPGDAGRLVGSYREALFADLARLLAELPHDSIAVQWDVAVEIGMLTGGFGGAAPMGYDAVAPSLLDCLSQVPADVPVGMHLCYGDYQHQHFMQPESLALQVGLVNALTAAAPRTIDWFSLTVPQDRADEAYFAPLTDLTSGAETGLSFGIVPYHPAAQPAGTAAAQVALIDRFLAGSAAGARDWAISTECGMGRAEPQDVPGLLDVHREILAGRR